MKKRQHNTALCQVKESASPPWAALFINANEQRFFSSLLLNLLHFPQPKQDENSEEAGLCHIPAQPVIDPDEENQHVMPFCPTDKQSAHLEAIFSFLTAATDGRITQTCTDKNDGRTIRPAFVHDVILLLGTLRINPPDNDTFMATLLQLTNTLEKCVKDMACLFHVTECPKGDHRECRFLMQSAAYLDNGATLDTMTRRCIVMVSRVQRKALTLALRRQRIKHEIDKRLAQPPTSPAAENPPDGDNNKPTQGTDSIFEARDVANALKDAYEREEELNEQLSQTRAQLEHITEMIDTTRHAIIKLSAFLLASYRTTCLRSQKTLNVLQRTANIPSVLKDTFAIESFCTNLLQTIEMLRQFSLNADKLIENSYDAAITHAIGGGDAPAGQAMPPLAADGQNPPAFLQKYEAINRLHEDTFAATNQASASAAPGGEEQNDEDDNQRQRHIRRLCESYGAFLQAIEQTRQHVNQHDYQRAPPRYPRRSLCFFHHTE